jgi:hypothetical protein
MVFHAVNIALHYVNSILVYLICCNFKTSKQSAAFGALVFAIHPFQIEPVAWITGFKDLSYTFFVLTGVLMYLQHRYWMLYICTMLGLFCKPAAIVICLLIPVISIFRGGRLEPALWCCLIGLPFIVFASNNQGLEFEIVWYKRIHIAVDSIGFYISRVFIPSDLSADHARYFPAIDGVIFGIPFLLYGLYKRSLWFFVIIIALSPVLGFVTFSYQEWSNVADRYMYLPMLGIALWISTIRFNSNKTIVALVLISIMTFVSCRYIPRWYDACTLHNDALYHVAQKMKSSKLRIKEKPNSMMIIGICEQRNGNKLMAHKYFQWAKHLNIQLTKKRLKEYGQ